MHELTKVCEICKEIFTSSLPLFWIRACSQDIFKTIKGTIIAVLRWLNFRLAIYLDDILLIGRTEEILMSRDT